MLIASLWLSLPLRAGPQSHASEPCSPGPCVVVCPGAQSVADRFKFSPFFPSSPLLPPPPPLFLPSSPKLSSPSTSSLFSVAHGASFPCVLGDLCLLLIVFGKIICNQLEHKMKDNTEAFVLAPSLEAPLPWAHPSPFWAWGCLDHPGRAVKTRPSETCVTAWLAFTPGVWPFWCSFTSVSLTISNKICGLKFCSLTFCIS